MIGHCARKEVGPKKKSKTVEKEKIICLSSKKRKRK
jgi:hypothetical protein